MYNYHGSATAHRRNCPDAHTRDATHRIDRMLKYTCEKVTDARGDAAAYRKKEKRRNRVSACTHMSHARAQKKR
jgi:hypothetical protein